MVRIESIAGILNLFIADRVFVTNQSIVERLKIKIILINNL